MKFHIMITTLLISLLSMTLNAYVMIDNDVNMFKSQNGKYEAISIPFYRYGKEGITIVKEQDKTLYQINGYFENGIISNNGESVVLYSTSILGHDNRDFLFDTVLFFVYNKGILLKSYKVLDFFAFLSELSASTSTYSWLYEADGGKTETPIEIVGSRLNIKTRNGFNWVVDLNTGNLISRKYNSVSRVGTRQVNSKKFESMIQSIDNFEIVSLSDFSKVEGKLQNLSFHAILRLKFNNNIFTVEVFTEDVLAFKEKFRLLVKAIKQYVEQNKLKGLKYKICCFYFDRSNKKLISGFNPYFTPDIESALEVMNQTFLIRKDSGNLFLETPVLIRYKLKGDAFSFEIVGR